LSLGNEPRQGIDDAWPIRGYGDDLFYDLFDTQRIDFSFLETRYKGKIVEDPLPDRYFEPAHKKAERLEKSIRNSEKGRAQHERDQIIRLLEGLQGPDWLRTMGVSGITESRKKSFEPAREYFIKGCQAILEKFRLWSLEEKRRKHEKGRAVAGTSEEDSSTSHKETSPEDGTGDEDSEGGEESEIGHKHDDGGEGEEQEDGTEDGTEDEEEQDDDEDVDDQEDAPDSSSEDLAEEKESEGDPPDYSDVDASVAKQLHDEALARSRISASRSPKRGRSAEKLPEPPRELRSFFKKKHEREGALSRHRRGGRKAIAWGEPIPDIQRVDFDLPEDYLGANTQKNRHSRWRRDRRGGNP
jgi:hypothetical protein